MNILSRSCRIEIEKSDIEASLLQLAQQCERLDTTDLAGHNSIENRTHSRTWKRPMSAMKQFLLLLLATLLTGTKTKSNVILSYKCLRGIGLGEIP